MAANTELSLNLVSQDPTIDEYPSLQRRFQATLSGGSVEANRFAVGNDAVYPSWLSSITDPASQLLVVNNSDSYSVGLQVGMTPYAGGPDTTISLILPPKGMYLSPGLTYLSTLAILPLGSGQTDPVSGVTYTTTSADNIAVIDVINV